MLVISAAVFLPPSNAYAPSAQNSVAAASMASATSCPGVKPALPIASTIRSSAARLCSRSGAKPPSSPTPVVSPCCLSTDFSAW